MQNINCHVADISSLFKHKHKYWTGHRQDGGPYRRHMPTLAAGIVTDTKGEKQQMIWTYYPKVKDIIDGNLYNYVKIHIIIF